jgi:hypothetical protein
MIEKISASEQPINFKNKFRLEGNTSDILSKTGFNSSAIGFAINLTL